MQPRTSSRVAPVKLTKLVLHKYRNVAPGTSLDFSGQRNVLLGQNGTGKTTLLELIVMVFSSNFSQLKDDEFGIEYELNLPAGHVRISVRNDRTPLLERLSQAIAEKLDRGPPFALEQSVSSLLPVVNVEFVPTEGVCVQVQINGAEVGIKAGEAALKESKTNLARAVFDGPVLLHVMNVAVDSLEEKVAAPFVSAILESFSTITSVALRFDESLDFLADLTSGRTVYASKRPDGYRVFPIRGFPWAILSSLKDRLGSMDVSAMEWTHEQLPFLGQLVELLGFASGSARIERVERKVREDGVEVTLFGNLRFIFNKLDRSIVDHTRLSYGQRRMLSFYCYLDSCPTVVVADELVNGLHHAWIEACLDAMGERQMFLTSQNPLLLDYLGFESAEEVRSSFILCRLEQQAGREVMRWFNMTQEEAEGFFSAYQVGIQHVSEILRTRGLW